MSEPCPECNAPVYAATNAPYCCGLCKIKAATPPTELVEEIEAELKSLLLAGIGESNPKEIEYIKKMKNILRKCLSALQDNKGKVVISREDAVETEGMIDFVKSTWVRNEGSQQVAARLDRIHYVFKQALQEQE